MLPGRNEIIDSYTARFQADPRVRALWLEGADGLGVEDEYSDLDLWFDALDEDTAQVLEDAIALAETWGPLDGCDRVPHADGVILQANLHVEGMSPYLTLDLCVQKHSRVATGCCVYTAGDIAELPKVLFDKDGIIRLTEPEPPDIADLKVQRDAACERFAQRGRVTKYIARGKYLETLAHYDEYVLEPLVILARLIHTPRHTEYGWTHISRHLPQELVYRLETLRCHGGLSDMGVMLVQADRLYGELNREFEKKYDR